MSNKREQKRFSIFNRKPDSNTNNHADRPYWWVASDKNGTQEQNSIKDYVEDLFLIAAPLILGYLGSEVGGIIGTGVGVITGLGIDLLYMYRFYTRG